MKDDEANDSRRYDQFRVDFTTVADSVGDLADALRRINEQQIYQGIPGGVRFVNTAPPSQTQPLPSRAELLEELALELAGLAAGLVALLHRQREAFTRDLWRLRAERDAAREEAARFRELYLKHGAGAGDIDDELLGDLIRLAHPDRHGNSERSNRATGKLLDIRRRRKG